jgi:hypothetical protein
VRVGFSEAFGIIWEASVRRAESVWALEWWVRRVVIRVVKVVVRVWVALKWVSTIVRWKLI